MRQSRRRPADQDERKNESRAFWIGCAFASNHVVFAVGGSVDAAGFEATED